jgi:plasmid stabilization system protein ParE
VIYTIEQLPEVDSDVLDLAKWIDRDDPDAADRFLIAVEETISSLRTMPGRGSPKHLRPSRLSSIRSLAVSGFPKHLVFYEIRTSVVVIVAVMHGARNYPRLLRNRIKDDN